MKPNKTGTFATPQFVICVPVEHGEELLLEETLREIAVKTARPATVFLFSPTPLRHPLAGAQTIQTTGAPSLAEMVCRLPEEFSTFDLLLLRPGTVVPESWDARLKWTAESETHIATVSPLCNESPIFSMLPEDSKVRPDLETLNRIAYWRGPKLTYEVPFYLPACAYIKRAALNSIPHHDWADVLSTPWKTSHALNANGFLNVLCDHVVVRAKEGGIL